MSEARRATVLFAVLIVVTLAALAGTTVLVAADAGVSSAQATLQRTQARALAWSGVQAVMAELASQRDSLLIGTPAQVTGEWTLFTDENGRRAVVRLLETGPEGIVASESGKLDLNAAAESSLAKLELIGPDLAARIVEARGQGRFSSAEDLLRVEGVTPELLFGEAPEGQWELSDAGRSSMLAAGADQADPGGLLNVVTVFSFDPNVQAGVGGEEHRGRLRINLGMAWSDALRTEITERFGTEAAAAVEQAMTAGEAFKKDADVVRKLRALSVPVEAWGPVLDAFTTTDEPYVVGRVDLAAAPEEVLACVPGIDAAAAAAIVEARGRLDDQTRLSVTWPLAQAILTPEQFEQAVDQLTTRSMVWRVRLEAGIVRPSADDDAPELSDRIVLDAVIDVSSERPRVAYLRDITALPTALAMHARLPDPEPVEEEAPEDPEAPDAGTTRPPTLVGSGGGGQPAPAERPSSRPRPGTGRSANAAGTPARAPGRATGEGPDRRVGRWTTGKQGSGGGS